MLLASNKDQFLNQKYMKTKFKMALTCQRLSSHSVQRTINFSLIHDKSQQNKNSIAVRLEEHPEPDRCSFDRKSVISETL